MVSTQELRLKARESLVDATRSRKPVGWSVVHQYKGIESTTHGLKTREFETRKPAENS